jgi:hypothetical protein
MHCLPVAQFGPARTRKDECQQHQIENLADEAQLQFENSLKAQFDGAALRLAGALI